MRQVVLNLTDEDVDILVDGLKYERSRALSVTLGLNDEIRQAGQQRAEDAYDLIVRLKAQWNTAAELPDVPDAMEPVVAIRRVGLPLKV